MARSFNTTKRFALCSTGFKTRWLVPLIPPYGLHYGARGSKPGGSFLQYHPTVWIMEHGVQTQLARSFNTTKRFALWSTGFKTRRLVPSIPPNGLHYGARGPKPGGSFLQYHHTVCIMEHGVQNQAARSFNTTIRFGLCNTGFKTSWLVHSIPPYGLYYVARGSKPGGSFLQYQHTVCIMEHGVQNQVVRSFNTTIPFALWSMGFKTRWLVPSIPPYRLHYGARGSKPGGSFLQYHHTVCIMEHGVRNQVARSFNTTIRFALWSTGFKTRWLVPSIPPYGLYKDIIRC